MDHGTKRQAAAGALVFGLGVATGLFAQNALEYDSPQRKEQKRMDLSGAPGMELIASVAEYRKGDVIRQHVHHGIETLYVIEGGTIQVPGKDPAPFPTGATVMFPRDVPHAGFAIVSDNPVKVFTVHAVDKGKPLYDWTK